MVDGKHGIDRPGLAAAATILISLENLFAEPGEVLPVGPLPVVATLTETPDIDRRRAAAAEEHPLPQAREPGRTDHFPSLPRFAFPAPGGDARRIFRSFSRHKPVMAARNPDRSSWDGANCRRNGAKIHKIRVSGNYPQQLTLSLVNVTENKRLTALFFHLTRQGLTPV
jgi:hypothetical protein